MSPKLRIGSHWLLQSINLPDVVCQMMVRIIIAGRDADPVECIENTKTDAVEKRQIAAFGPGLLKRGKYWSPMKH